MMVQQKLPFLVVDRNKIRKKWIKTDSEIIIILKELKLWSSIQNLPEIPNDNILEFILTSNKYDLEKTKANILSYYSIRTKVPEMFKNTHPLSPEMKDVWKMGVYCPLPRLQEGLYRVSLIKMLPYTSDFDAFKFYANIANVYEVRLNEDLSLSEIIVADHECLHWGHIIKQSPFVMKKVFEVAEGIARTRVKQIHIVAAPFYINFLLNLVKRFLKKKLANRFYIHKSIDTVYKYVSKEILPSDYGGNEKPLDELTEIWKKKLEDYNHRFDTLQKFAERS